jgi:hypothetical protein
MLLPFVCPRDPFDHSMMGTVGLPLPGVDMRLEAVPELGYLPSDPKAPKGEVSAGWLAATQYIWSCMHFSKAIETLNNSCSATVACTLGIHIEP